MRIAIVSQSCDNSTGIGRIVLSLAREFHARNHEVNVVAQTFDHLPQGIGRQQIPSVPRVNSLNRLMLRYITPSRLNSLQCDVSNTFGVGKGASVVTAQSCHKAGIDIRNVHRDGIVWKRNLGLFDTVALTDEQELVCSPTTRRIIAVSTLVKEQILSYYKVEPERIVVIPNGVDIRHFNLLRRNVDREALRQRYDIHPDELLLLFVGNEFDRKGLQFIIEGLALLRRKELKLLVVGADEQGPYRRLASSLNVEGHLVFAGKVRGPEDLFFAADIFVFPTVYEPFGLVILEAMAAGLPVITSRDAGAVEGLQHEVNGLFLDDPSSVHELSHAIQRLADDETLRMKMSETNLTTVQSYSWDKIADMTLDVYKEISQK